MKFYINFFLFFLFSISNVDAFIPRYHAPLDIRVLNQGNYARIVFEWIGEARYKVEEKGNIISIAFDRTTTFDPQLMTSKLPRRVGFKGIKTHQNQMIFTFEAHPNTQEKISTRHYKQGFKIVLDIFFENKTNAHHIYNNSTKHSHSTLKRIDQIKDTQKIEPISTSSKIRINTKNNVDEVFIPIKGKINPILYKRGPNIWLVQNSEQNWDISPLKKFSPKIYKQDKITALLLNTSQIEMPKMVYDKAGVKLYFNVNTQSKETKEETYFKLSRESILDSKIEINLENNNPNNITSNPIKFKDPLTGEELYLLETYPDFSVQNEQKFIDFKILKASAGLSLIPYTDDLTFKQDKNSLTITRPHGLRLGPEIPESPKNDLPKDKSEKKEHIQQELPNVQEQPKEATPEPINDKPISTEETETPRTIESISKKEPLEKTKNENTLEETSKDQPKENQTPVAVSSTTPSLEHSESIVKTKTNTFFDLKKWYPSNDFLKDRNIYEEKIVETDPPSPNSIYDLASFYIAYDLAPEAQNLLKSFKEQAPESEKSFYFQGLMGISNLYKENYDEAIANFGDKQLDLDPSIPTWRWVANFLKKDKHDDKTIEAPKEIDLSLLPRYLKHSIYLRLLKNDLAQEKFEIFDQNYSQIKQSVLSTQEKNYLDYLMGWSDYLKGNHIGGLNKWKKLTKIIDRFTSSHARYAIASKGPENNFITKKEAILDLETLRFAWRGDQFEYKVIQLLGRYLLDLHLYKRGLRTLKDLITLFPDNPSNKEVTATLAETFSNIFINDEISSKYSPMDLILLYENFKELSPLDKKGDLVQEKIAKAYFELNLLDDSQKILDHLLKFRSEGNEKSLRGFTLAQTLALNKKENEALSVLDASETPNIKPELAIKRQNLRINLHKQKGELDNALHLLANKQDIDNQRLKAEIYIEKKEWSKAAEIYDTICSTQKDLTTEKDIFYYMTSLVYMGNYTKIEQISKTYKDYMEKEPYKNAFLLIASTLKPGNDKKMKEQLEDFLTKFKTYNASV